MYVTLSPSVNLTKDAHILSKSSASVYVQIALSLQRGTARINGNSSQDLEWLCSMSKLEGKHRQTHKVLQVEPSPSRQLESIELAKSRSRWVMTPLSLLWILPRAQSSEGQPLPWNRMKLHSSSVFRKVIVVGVKGFSEIRWRITHLTRGQARYSYLQAAFWSSTLQFMILIGPHFTKKWCSWYSSSQASRSSAVQRHILLYALVRKGNQLLMMWHWTVTSNNCCSLKSQFHIQLPSLTSRSGTVWWNNASG